MEKHIQCLKGTQRPSMTFFKGATTGQDNFFTGQTAPGLTGSGQQHFTGHGNYQKNTPARSQMRLGEYSSLVQRRNFNLDKRDRPLLHHKIATVSALKPRPQEASAKRDPTKNVRVTDFYSILIPALLFIHQAIHSSNIF